MESRHPKPIFVHGSLCQTSLLSAAITGDSKNELDILQLLQHACVYRCARTPNRDANAPDLLPWELSRLEGWLLHLEAESQRKNLIDYVGGNWQLMRVAAHTYTIDADGTPREHVFEADALSLRRPEAVDRPVTRPPRRSFEQFLLDLVTADYGVERFFNGIVFDLDRLVMDLVGFRYYLQFGR